MQRTQKNNNLILRKLLFYFVQKTDSWRPQLSLQYLCRHCNEFFDANFTVLSLMFVIFWIGNQQQQQMSCINIKAATVYLWN